MLSVVMKETPTRAAVTGHSLVALFGNAAPPLAWQFDLEKNHSFTLMLQGQDGKWDLGVTMQRNEFIPVAHFVDRADADEAFAAVTKAMAGSRGRHSGWMGLVRGAFLTAIFLLIGFIVLSFIFGGKSETKPQQATAINPPPVMKPAGIQNGVPMSADDILKMPP